MSGQKPREIAVRVLQRRADGDFAEHLLDIALARTRLSAADRHLCQELSYGIVRWQATLDWLIARKSRHPIQKPVVQNLLRLGLYQIFWLDRIPNHAAVHETVELAKQLGFGSQAGFVNAVLRGYLRELEPTKQRLADLRTSQPSLGYSHPEWLVLHWQQRWGPEATVRLMEWNNTPPRTFVRVNALKANPGNLLTQWREEGVEYDFVRRDWLEENSVFELKAHPPMIRLPSFKQGLFYVQDPSTLLAVRELNPQPGETVLDLCAAPGGKMAYIAQLMRNKGRLVAYDTAPERLKLIQENCARLGLTCVGILGQKTGDRRQQPGESHQEAGAGSPKQLGMAAARVAPSSLDKITAEYVEEQLRSEPESSFDRILIDAPCSNTGVMRRRVDLRWRVRREEIERLGAAQLDLLRKAATLLKPGGILVYSTCSLELEENRQVVNAFLGEQKGLRLEHDRELLPFVDAVDGAYVARMVRTG